VSEDMRKMGEVEAIKYHLMHNESWEDSVKFLVEPHTGKPTKGWPKILLYNVLAMAFLKLTHEMVTFWIMTGCRVSAL
jgi:hypothetical protein